MVITKEWLIENFRKFNKKYFDNQLVEKEIDFKVNPRLKSYGCASDSMDDDLPKRYSLEVSSFYNASEEETINTLIHEMIHLLDYMTRPKTYKEWMSYDAHGEWFLGECKRIDPDGKIGLGPIGNLFAETYTKRKRPHDYICFCYKNEKPVCISLLREDEWSPFNYMYDHSKLKALVYGRDVDKIEVYQQTYDYAHIIFATIRKAKVSEDGLTISYNVDGHLDEIFDYFKKKEDYCKYVKAFEGIKESMNFIKTYKNFLDEDINNEEKGAFDLEDEFELKEVTRKKITII